MSSYCPRTSRVLADLKIYMDFYTRFLRRLTVVLIKLFQDFSPNLAHSSKLTSPPKR